MTTDLTMPLATARAYISNTRYQTIITSGKHALIADEPEEKEGSDMGMNPFELLLASLSSCTAITLQMYINRKLWIVEDISIEMQMFPSESGTFIKSSIQFTGNLTDEQKKRLKHIADVCPVHKILTGSISIETIISE